MKVIEDKEINRMVFWCNGCEGTHSIPVNGQNPNGPEWKFNGDMEYPTFKPSIKVTSTGLLGKDICHSYVTDGKISYLGDCTHSLKSKTVNLLDESQW